MTNYNWSLRRGEWEEPGYTIAEHTSSPPLDWDAIVGITIHYPGARSIHGPATPETLGQHLRSSQRWYVNERGYSYGYNAVVWDGVSGEVRGDAYRCAANGNTVLNRDKFAIQIRVEGQGADAAPASEADILEVRHIVAWAEAQAGRELAIEGHRDLKATACPGDAIYTQVTSGVFRPVTAPPPAPTEHPLRIIAQPSDGWWSLARRAYGNESVAGHARLLEEANGSRPIHPGDVLIVPGRAVAP